MDCGAGPDDGDSCHHSFPYHSSPGDFAGGLFDLSANWNGTVPGKTDAASFYDSHGVAADVWLCVLVYKRNLPDDPHLAGKGNGRKPGIPSNPLEKGRGSGGQRDHAAAVGLLDVTFMHQYLFRHVFFSGSLSGGADDCSVWPGAFHPETKSEASVSTGTKLCALCDLHGTLHYFAIGGNADVGFSTDY